MIVSFECDGRLVEEGDDGSDQLGSGRGVKEAWNSPSNSEASLLVNGGKINFRSKVVLQFREITMGSSWPYDSKVAVENMVCGWRTLPSEKALAS